MSNLFFLTCLAACSIMLSGRHHAARRKASFMPTPKTKPTQPAAEPKPAPAAAEASSIAEYQATREARMAVLKRDAQVIRDLLGDLDGHDLEAFQTLRLILDRDHGCTTPVEEFLAKLIHVYAWADAGGRGLTVDDIETEMI